MQPGGGRHGPNTPKCLTSHCNPSGCVSHPRQSSHIPRTALAVSDSCILPTKRGLGLFYKGINIAGAPVFVLPLFLLSLMTWVHMHEE